MTTKPQGKEKKVKAWAILRGRKVIAIEFTNSKPTRGTWQFFIEDWNSDQVVPCTIFCSLPTKKAKKK